MCTLSVEESREVKRAGMDLKAPDDPFLMSWAGLKCLDMTHVRLAYGSITTVDLSGNLLVSLPDSFSRSLRHVQYLDLSRNKLMSLPRNFGKMESLHTLLLYMNQLETLPVSFRKLDKLRWLDISTNPLEPRLLEICGEDLTYCEVVARNVIEFMRDLHNAKESTEISKPSKIPEIQQIEDYTEEGGISAEGDSMAELYDEMNCKRVQLKNSSHQSLAAHQLDEDNGLTSLITTALYCILLPLGLFIFMSFALAMYNQGPPKSLGKLQEIDGVPSLALNSFAWAVHMCPGCVPFRQNVVQTIVIQESSFFQSFIDLFFRPLYNRMG